MGFNDVDLGPSLLVVTIHLLYLPYCSEVA